MLVFCVPKPLVASFGCDELVLYGIRLLAKQRLDMELENPDTKEITRTETLWKLMDENQDGEISRAEFGETLGNLSERQVKFLFSKYDQNKDRRINREEFSQMMEEWSRKKKNKAK